MTTATENKILKAKNLELEREVLYLKQELNTLKRQVFGPRSERKKSLLYGHGQLSLFDEEIQPETELKTETLKEKKQTKRKVRRRVQRAIFPSSLQREEEVMNPPHIDEQLYEKIGEDITEILAYKPGQVYVKRLVRPRWVLKGGHQSRKENKEVVQENIPARLIPKGMVDESLIAHILVEKFMFHTPVYRLAKKYKQIGVDCMKTRNLHNWIHRSAEALLPLYYLLYEDMMGSSYLQADESHLRVLSKNKPGASHTGYMWLIHDPQRRATLFHYDSTRQHRVAHELFGTYKGILQTDGYKAYQSVAQVNGELRLMHCFAHARRKFVDASNTDPPLAQHYLEEVGKLYHLEKRLREQEADADTRYRERQRIAVPILSDLKRWLESQHNKAFNLPKSSIGKAIRYSLKHWEGLCAYTQDGRVEIDNNYIENKVRPLALGRKNYLFAKNAETARNLACLYSLILTAEAQNLRMDKYLEWVLRKSACEKMNEQAINWLPHKLSPKDKQLFVLK